jgi:ABC-2 type transport system ATP-binding protein
MDAGAADTPVVAEGAADLPAAADVASRWAMRPPVIDPDQRRLTMPVAAGSVTLPELVRQLDAAGVRAEDVSVRRPTRLLSGIARSPNEPCYGGVECPSPFRR